MIFNDFLSQFMGVSSGFYNGKFFFFQKRSGFISNTVALVNTPIFGRFLYSIYKNLHCIFAGKDEVMFFQWNSYIRKEDVDGIVFHETYFCI